MTDFTFTGPDGKSHVVTGPEGATQDQAFKILQQHLASQPGGAPGGAQPSGLGDLWSKALANLPEGVRSQAAALIPSWSHNDPSYNPLRPADPRNMPNDAINPVGNDAQMVGATAAAGGMGGLAAGARALAGAPTPAPTPPPPGPSVPSVAAPAPPPAMIKPGPTQGPWGTAPAPAPVIRGPGGKWMPNPAAQPQPAPAASPAPMATPPTQPGHMSAASYRQQMGLPPPGSDPAIPSNPITTAPPLPGTSPAQLQFLKQAVPEGAGLLGHLLGGPVGGILGRAGTRAMMRGMS